MTGKALRDVAERVDQEGFDYTFAHYSNFDEIKDVEFHNLRKAFLTSREAFIEYLGLEDC